MIDTAILAATSAGLGLVAGACFRGSWFEFGTLKKLRDANAMIASLRRENDRIAGVNLQLNVRNCGLTDELAAIHAKRARTSELCRQAGRKGAAATNAFNIARRAKHEQSGGETAP